MITRTSRDEIDSKLTPEPWNMTVDDPNSGPESKGTGYQN